MPKERDQLWKFVKQLPDNKWRCNFCGKEAAGGLTRMKAHFAQQPGFGITPCKKVDRQARAAARQSIGGESTSASNEDDRRETSFTATLYQASDVISTAGASSSAFVSVPETNFPNQPRSAQMIRQRDTPSLPQPPQSHAGDFDRHPRNLCHPTSSSRDFAPVPLADSLRPLNAEVGDLHTEVPQGEMPGAMNQLLDWAGLNEYAGGQHFAGDGGYQIHGLKVVDGRVGSEALQVLRAVGSSNRLGNVEGSSNLTQGPHQFVSASNEDARRDTSCAAMLYWSSDVLSTAVAGSSAFNSVPETNVPSQSCSAQTLIQQSHTQFRPQSLQSHAGDFYMQPRNLTYPSSSLDLTPEALANTQRPLNTEVGDINTEVQQGKMPRATDPSLDRVEFLNGNARGPFTEGHFLQASKLTRVVESSNRQGNVEGSANITQGPHQIVPASNGDDRRETSFTATLYQGSDVISTAGASSSAFVSVPETNFPNHSRSAQMIRQRDTPSLPQPPQSHAGDFDRHPQNLCHPTSSSQDFTKMWCRLNAELGDLPNREMPRATDPSLDRVEVLNEYTGGSFFKEHFAGEGGYGIYDSKVISGGVRSEALQASKPKGVVESSNRQDNVEGSANITPGPHQLVSASNEDAQSETSFAAILYQSLDVISTGVASSSAFVSVPETNVPNQSCSAQTLILQSPTQFRPQSLQSHTGDFYMQSWNWTDPSSSLDLTPEALANMHHPLNAVAGDVNTEVQQGASTELASAENEPSAPGLANENMTSHITELEGLIISGEAEFKTIKEDFSRLRLRAVQERRSLTPKKAAEMEDLRHTLERILLFLKDVKRRAGIL